MPKPIQRANDTIWTHEARGKHEQSFWDGLTSEHPDYEYPAVDSHAWKPTPDYQPGRHRAPDQPSEAHQLWDKTNQGFDHWLTNEEEHVSAPFKAISEYDQYIDPATAEAKRHKELADMGRDAVEGMGHAFLVGASTRNFWTQQEVAEERRNAGELSHGGRNKRLAAASQPRYIFLPHWDPEASYEIMHDHNDDMAGSPQPRLALQVSPQLMDEAKQGGFTLHDHIGDAPTNGYMVSLDKNTEDKMPMAQLTPQHIQDFVTKNARSLQDPDSYLGGWLDNGNFYLDVSHHFNDLSRAANQAAGASQLGIYDLGKGRTIDTDEAGWMTGAPGIVGSRNGYDARHSLLHPAQGRRGSRSQHTASGRRTAAPNAGGVQPNGAGPEPPAVAVPPPPNFDPAQATFVQGNLGSHGAQKWKSKDGSEWLVKPSKSGEEFLTEGEYAASQLATKSGLAMPHVQKTQLQGKPAMAQLWVPGELAWPDKQVDFSKVSPEDIETLQKNQAYDWLVGNHDAHPAQFLRDPQGKLFGIDKGQAFKHYADDRLDWNSNPNGAYVGETEPIYNTMMRDYAKGGVKINDPRQGKIAEYIKNLQNMPDSDVISAITPYTEGAAKAGFLAKPWGYAGLEPKPRFKGNDPKAFYQAVLDRKHHLMEQLGDYYDKARAYRMTGLKIAAGPKPFALKNTHLELGSHGATVHTDPEGNQWLVKPTPPGEDFRVPLDVATSHLQKMLNLPAQEVHAYQLPNGQQATAHKMWPVAPQAFPKPPNLSDLSPEDLDTLQRHQALDWMIANHDPHVGNFLRTPDNQLVGIDKGQAFKYFGRDRLDNTFHPNFYAREPIYNKLWRDFSSGQPGQMQDPRQGQLGEFVHHLSSIPDDEVRHLFRPYAESAAKAGLLATGGPDDPRRKLGPPGQIQPNNPDVFLDALIARKRNLATDLGNYYDKMATMRHQHTPKTAAGLGLPGLDIGSALPQVTNALTNFTSPTTGGQPKVPGLGQGAPPNPLSTMTNPSKTSPGDSGTANPTGDKNNFSGITQVDAKGNTKIPRTPAFLQELGAPDFSAWQAGGGPGGSPGAANPSGGTTPGTTSPGSPATTSPGSVPLTKNPDGTYTSPDPAWKHLIDRESGGHNIKQSPSTHDVNSGGNEAFGIFQITPGTWSAHGGQGSVYNSTPEQQAQVAADILRKNPSGSDWGAGLSGREDASALRRALGSYDPDQEITQILTYQASL